MNSRLKEVRKTLEMTQEKFAESLGISRTNLTNIELGKIQLTNRLIKTVCSVYKVDEEWIRTGNGEMFTQHDDNFESLLKEAFAENDDFKKKLIKNILSLDEEKLMLIKQLINNLSV